MPDIFISYSRKDSEHAITLAEKLRAGGMDVWIDQRGIVGAEKWATEIVEGIRACSTFLVLLSPDSIASENVLKELSLASEKRKRILPVEVEPMVLPSTFEYSLAGLQRLTISDFDGIVRAHKHGVSRVVAKDSRKSLLVLPFEDLSPSQDNGWFADGLASELIAALGNVKALRLIDWNTSREFKTRKVPTAILAKELEVRYFLEGQVRKSGPQIKVSVSLLDFETGDHLWQDSLKGTMEDVFDFQEKVAEKVLDGLKVHLASDEKRRLTERGTENAEAYELFLKANDFFNRQSNEGFRNAIQLYADAIELDAGYADAYSGKAKSLAALNRTYDRNPALLDEAFQLSTIALRLKPDLWRAYAPLVIILQLQGKIEEAELAAIEYVRNAPEDCNAHFTHGFLHSANGQPAKAIGPYEHALKLNPEHLTAIFNLASCFNMIGDQEKGKYWSGIAIPMYEKHLKLFPNDEYRRVSHAALLYWAGREDEAREAARSLGDLRNGAGLFNTAMLQRQLADYEGGLKTFRKAIEAGFRGVKALQIFLSDDDEGMAKLKGTPEYEQLREMVEQIEADETAKTADKSSTRV